MKIIVLVSNRAFSVRGLSLILGTLLLSLALGPALLRAEPVLQRLDQTNSRARFSLSSSAGTMRGEFLKYSGLLRLDLEELNRSAVSLEIFPSSATLQSGDPGQEYVFRSLMSALAGDMVKFQSRSVEAVGSELRIKGFATSGGQDYEIGVPVRILSRGRERSVFSGSIGSDALSLPVELPFGGSTGVPFKGEAEFVLAFKR